MGSNPCSVKAITPSGRIAEGATGRPPAGCSERWLMRPTCQSWQKMWPPLACTASVTSFHPATCASV
jgi:hypothetical protein